MRCRTMEISIRDRIKRKHSLPMSMPMPMSMRIQYIECDVDEKAQKKKEQIMPFRTEHVLFASRAQKQQNKQVNQHANGSQNERQKE